MARDFSFFTPLSFFEKAGAEPGRQRRIGGVISTEKKDKQGETVLQRGLDFRPFLKSGWFNDNHSKDTFDGILGYPEGVKLFQKGDALPDGRVADVNGTWAEGYLLDTPKGQKCWELGMALQKAGAPRRLGFSVEGKVLEREGYDQKLVTKAVVRNVAITNCPVGEDTRLEMLVKSLEAAEEAQALDKGMTTGATTPPALQGPQTGPSGRIISQQSLEHDGQKHFLKQKDDEDDDDVISKSEAIAAIQNRLGCDTNIAERTYDALMNLKAAGQL